MAALPERPLSITVGDVYKSFGRVEALRGVSLEILDGEFFTLLGPSGCGKTTILRLIAGFEEPDRGTIYLRGRDVTDAPPNRRNVNLVFQHYALFPHMSVYDNVAFGLKLKKVRGADQRQRVSDILELVELTGLERRRPAELSGGQQQRVALARALVNRPDALLLDEPLGALDVKLRRQLQIELKRLQAEIGTTFVYVTHDQDEALAMSDRIAVLNHGALEQVGTPRELYERPSSRFCAGFVGLLNVIDLSAGELSHDYGLVRYGELGYVVVPPELRDRPAERLRVALRPEFIHVYAHNGTVPAGQSRLEGTVAEVIYLGMVTQLNVDTPVGPLGSQTMTSHETAQLQVGQRVTVTWRHEHCVLVG